MSWPRKPTLKWHPCRQSQSKVASKEIVFNKFWLQCLLMENKTCGVLGTGLNSNLSLFSKFSCKGLIGKKAAAKVSGLVEKVTSASVKLSLRFNQFMFWVHFRNIQGHDFFRSFALTSTQTMSGSKQSQMLPMLTWILFSGAETLLFKDFKNIWNGLNVSNAPHC